MPYKSEAQKAKIKQLYEQGKISKKDFEEFERKSEGLKLPDRLSPPKDKLAYITPKKGK